MMDFLRKFVLATFVFCLTTSAMPMRAHAADTSGIHAFFNDDSSQFVDLWLNDNGHVTIKASNGRPWRPMWVVVHATFLSGSQVMGKKDYHVYCGSPTPGGHGNEKWFVYGNPGFSGVTAVSLSTNKEAPWGRPKGGWEVEISGSTKF
jgi:hypothetical protein